MASLPARRRPSLLPGLIALVLGVAVLAGAGVYLYANAHHVPQVVHHQPPSDGRPFASWMTPRYIARTYHVPESVLLQALGISAADARHKSLAEIASAQHVPLLRVRLEAARAVRTYRLGRTATPTPTAGPPGSGR